MIIKEAVKNFEQTQSKFRSFGATDTEPDTIFQSLLRKAMSNKEFEVPTTPNGWELYSDMPGVDEAAKELAEAAKKCVEIISEAGQISSFIKSYCWRYN